MEKNQKNKTLVVIALISSLASLAIHIYLALNHYKLKFGVSEGKSLCNINAQLNCDVVAVSKYASFLTYPIATWGAMTHLILSLFLVLWMIGLMQNPLRVYRLTTWLSIFIAAMSLIMGAISSFALGTYCLFCIFTYLLSFALMGSLLAANQTSLMEHLAEDFRSLLGSHKWILVCLAVIPAGTVFSGSIIQQELLGTDSETLRGIIQDSVSAWQSAPSVPFTDQGLIFQAEPIPAKVTIVEFADFLCPHCRLFSQPLHNFIQAHPTIKLIFKAFPLDGICNDEKIPKHDGIRCELVYADLCAEKLFQKGWQVQEYIFSHQQDWDVSRLEKDLEKMSQDLSFNLTSLRECMNKTETHDMARSIAKEGVSIQGTPAVFVNGRELPRGNIMPILDAAVSSLNP